MKKIVAVTGGSGFIGRRLVARLLMLGYEVRVLTRDVTSKDKTSKIKFFEGDLVNSTKEQLVSFLDEVDTLYHCAAEIHNESLMFATNVEGTRKLSLLAKHRIKRWVQLSTVGVYGLSRKATITEESAPNPANEYESTKLLADIAMLDNLENSDVAWAMLRPSKVFGSGMPNSSLEGLINAILSNRFFYVGSKKTILTYVHVDDVVNALIMCGELEAASGQIFNLSEDISIKQLVDLIANTSGERYIPCLPEIVARTLAKLFTWHSKFPLTNARIDGLVRQIHYPVNKIQEKLGYQPVKGVYNGFKEML